MSSQSTHDTRLHHRGEWDWTQTQKQEKNSFFFSQKETRRQIWAGQFDIDAGHNSRTFQYRVLGEAVDNRVMENKKFNDLSLFIGEGKPWGHGSLSEPLRKCFREPRKRDSKSWVGVSESPRSCRGAGTGAWKASSSQTILRTVFEV